MSEFNIVAFGDAGVGKTSIIYRYTDDIFNSAYNNTVGVDYKVKRLDINCEEVTLKIWDTAGQENFRSITKLYFRRADGIFIVFDVSNRQSFVNVKDWLKLIEDDGNNYAQIILVGNKCDLERSVSEDDALKFAYDHNLQYFDSSAKDGTNIEAIFDYMARNCKEKPHVEPLPQPEHKPCEC